MKFLPFGLMFLLLFSQNAYSQSCTNPNATPGTLFFNVTEDVLQGCTANAGWVALHGDTGFPTDCPMIGDTCDDGSIYVGRSPDGNVPMFTTPADAPSTYNWNDGTGNFTDTTMGNCLFPGAPECRTGEANTAFLVGATSEPDYPFEAAEYCNGLSAHGHNDWYLPALDELNVLITNRNFGDLNGTFDPVTQYWSSSESKDNVARAQNTGSQWERVKDTDVLVRCVRK